MHPVDAVDGQVGRWDGIEWREGRREGWVVKNRGSGEKGRGQGEKKEE